MILVTWYLVDGMDGSGKSTVADELKRMLEARGRRVMMFTHPSDVTVPGRLSAKFLTKTGKAATILSTGFYVMDALRSIASMRINKRKYDDVIFVRYIMAVAYMPEKHYRKLYRDIEIILPMPEVRIFVDIDAETAMQRILSRGEELEMFETVDQLADTRRKMLSLTDNGWIVISNSGELSETFRQLEQGVFDARPRVPGGALPWEGQGGQVHLAAHLPPVHGHRRLRRHFHMAG